MIRRGYKDLVMFLAWRKAKDLVFLKKEVEKSKNNEIFEVMN